MSVTTLPPFQRLLDEHRDEVYRVLVAMAGPDEADDCFQETFMSASVHRAEEATRGADPMSKDLQRTLAHGPVLAVDRVDAVAAGFGDNAAHSGLAALATRSSPRPWTTWWP